MFYAPHILYKEDSEQRRDEFNRILDNFKRQLFVGKCRCDDSNIKDAITINGKNYVPQYHIVCDKCDIKVGDYITVKYKNGNVRAKGKVINVNKCNYLDYMNLYV